MKFFWHKLLRSKTLWLNIIGAIVLFIQTKTAYIVPVEFQTFFMFAANFIVRFATGEPIAGMKDPTE